MNATGTGPWWGKEITGSGGGSKKKISNRKEENIGKEKKRGGKGKYRKGIRKYRKGEKRGK